jgi:hypothetical protein
MLASILLPRFGLGKRLGTAPPTCAAFAKSEAFEELAQYTIKVAAFEIGVFCWLYWHSTPIYLERFRNALGALAHLRASPVPRAITQGWGGNRQL